MTAKRLTSFQTKKQTQQLAFLLGIVVILSALFLLVHFPQSQDTGSVAADSEKAARIINQTAADITIPRAFFDKKVLEGFTPYTPLEVPSSWGRTNPFNIYTPSKTIGTPVETKPTSAGTTP